jgi:RimJ/RimL family protein N-acetyltransferase
VYEEILGDGVVLRRWQPRHLEELRDIVARSLPHIAAFMPSAAREVADPEAFLALVNTAWDDGVVFAYAIERDGRAVGHITSPPAAGGEIGCWIRIEDVGSGLGTTALRAVADAALASNPALSHVRASCNAANAASARMLTKAHFHVVERRPWTPRTPAEADEELVWLKNR